MTKHNSKSTQKYNHKIINLNTLLFDILKKACKIADATASSIWLLQPDKKTVICRQAIGPGKKKLIGWELNIKQGFVGWVIRNKKSLIKSEAMSNKIHYKKICKKINIKLESILSVPLIYQDKIIGVLQVVDRKTNQFNNKSLKLIEPFAISASIAIENTKRIQKEQKDRKKTENELRKAHKEIETRLKVRNKDLKEINTKLKKNLKEKEKIEEELKFLANHDYLTGAVNRNGLKVEFKKQLENNLEKERQSAILFIDIDDFKNINNTYGHTTGDLLLKKIVQRSRDILRSDDYIARTGGDEFVILLNDVNMGKTKKITKRLAKSIKNSIRINNKLFKITVSIGIVFFPKDGDNLKNLLKKADSAMYKSKNKGKGRIVFYKNS